ncbi:hypothetical protein MMC25_006636 [Agyrium rufum]|nr:hypothetical protein [Agyrium rufum]
MASTQSLILSDEGDSHSTLDPSPSHYASVRRVFHPRPFTNLQSAVSPPPLLPQQPSPTQINGLPTSQLDPNLQNFLNQVAVPTQYVTPYGAPSSDRGGLDQPPKKRQQNQRPTPAEAVQVQQAGDAQQDITVTDETEENLQKAHISPILTVPSVPSTPNHQQAQPPQDDIDSVQPQAAEQHKGDKEKSHFTGMRIVLDPPDLEKWRNDLFELREPITLTEEQFQTYFPHVDNIYSHRSTQTYKRKPFISHYWDCRLKGRPPGTPKSIDPAKRKRKRTTRERNLCDVKVKITEHFPDSITFIGLDFGSKEGPPQTTSMHGVTATTDRFDASTQQDSVQDLERGRGGFTYGKSKRYFTIERVNGGNLEHKYTQPPAEHKHTLEESDRVKKSTIQRHLNEEAIKLKKIQSGEAYTTSSSSTSARSMTPHVPQPIFPISRYQRLLYASSSYITLPRKMDFFRRSLGYFSKPAHDPNLDTNQGGDANKKTYAKKASGTALFTVKRHAKEQDLKLFGSCFCPFVQRVWIALEAKGIPYQYIEVDPYKKPQSLLEVNPHGLVPAVRHGDWAIHESTVIMEYLEDLNIGEPLLPPGDAKRRAYLRLWADHVNRRILPSFYSYLQAQDEADQISHGKELEAQVRKLVEAADPEGPFFNGRQLSLVDVNVAPWFLRMQRVLKPYRGWPDPDEGSRFKLWLDALEENTDVKNTVSEDVLYLDSYERYAENRPNTSQVANAINSGKGLP